MSVQADVQAELEFFERLPAILESLESSSTERLATGALSLASLLDESTGYQAQALGEFMRECGALELIAGPVLPFQSPIVTECTQPHACSVRTL